MATSETPVERAGRTGRRRTPWAALGFAGPAATAVVALISSGVALTFTLWPRLAPDPGTTYRAEVQVFAVERGVTFHQYLQRIAFSPALRRKRRAELMRGISGAADIAGWMALPGEVVYVESTVEGFKRRSVSLRWSLYDARTQRRDLRFSDQLAVRLDLATPTDRTMQLIWVPPPPRRRPYIVRVGLYDDQDTPLDMADSMRFMPP